MSAISRITVAVRPKGEGVGYANLSRRCYLDEKLESVPFYTDSKLPVALTLGKLPAKKDSSFAKDQHNQFTLFKTRQLPNPLHQIIASGLVCLPIRRSIVLVNCPQCTSQRIHQSRRRGIMERILSMMFVRPFRCEGCDLRFFRWSFTANPNSSRPATTY